MKRVRDPAAGKDRSAKKILVAESHEKHLVNSYPSLQGELTRLRGTRVPASFSVIPGKVTGKRLVQLGVAGICPGCGKYESNPNSECRVHPKNSGGGNSWLIAA